MRSGGATVCGAERTFSVQAVQRGLSIGGAVIGGSRCSRSRSHQRVWLWPRWCVGSQHRRL
ncbi:hypothetical protein PTTG_01496, partial [Puccinia triticina 1-1 BBBD Race 1]